VVYGAILAQDISTGTVRFSLQRVYSSVRPPACTQYAPVPVGRCLLVISVQSRRKSHSMSFKNPFNLSNPFRKASQNAEQSPRSIRTPIEPPRAAYVAPRLPFTPLAPVPVALQAPLPSPPEDCGENLEQLFNQAQRILHQLVSANVEGV
jgi:hypothetical protein